jgi:hypothetical protein
MLASAAHGNLFRFIVPAVVRPCHRVPLPAPAAEALSESGLKMAASRGRLRAQKGSDGQWRGSRAVNEYRANRQVRRTG